MGALVVVRVGSIDVAGAGVVLVSGGELSGVVSCSIIVVVISGGGVVVIAAGVVYLVSIEELAEVFGSSTNSLEIAG